MISGGFEMLRLQQRIRGLGMPGTPRIPGSSVGKAPKEGLLGFESTGFVVEKGAVYACGRGGDFDELGFDSCENQQLPARIGNAQPRADDARTEAVGAVNHISRSEQTRPILVAHNIVHNALAPALLAKHGDEEELDATLVVFHFTDYVIIESDSHFTFQPRTWSLDHAAGGSAERFLF